MSSNNSTQVNNSDPSVARQVQRQTDSLLRQSTISSAPSVNGSANTTTISSSQAARSLAPIISGSEVLYPLSTTATSNDAVTISSSVNNDAGDITTVYATDGQITVNPINQTINQYISTDSGVSQIVAGTGVIVTSTGAGGKGVVTISSSAGELGNIVSVDLDGNIYNVLHGDGSWGPDQTAMYGNSNVVSLLDEFGSNTITTTGTVTVGNIVGNGRALTGITGANVTGFVPNANVANTALAVNGANVSGFVPRAYVANLALAVAGANVTGFVPNANVANTALAVDGANVSGFVPRANVANIAFSVAGANVSGFVPNANVANTALAIAAANVTGLGNIAVLNLTGSNSSVLYGNGVFAAVANGTGIANGTSNVSIPAPNSNVNISAAGNANIFVVAGTGVTVSGTTNISGNANVGNIGTARVLASANITAPQLISNIATGTAPLVVTSNTVVANLNANALQGSAPAAANTASTIALRDANGNLSANYFIGNGSLLTGLSSTSISNGNSNLSIPSANGNVNISAAGNANILVVTGTGVNVAGTLNTTGNITAEGNVRLNRNLDVAGYLDVAGIGYVYNLNVTGNITQTTSNPVVRVFQTWNNASTQFTGIVANFVSVNSGANSAANSLLIDLRTDSGSKFAVNKSGNIYAAGNIITGSGSGGNITGANVITANTFIGNGSQLTGLTTYGISNGSSYVAIPAANGNVTINSGVNGNNSGAIHMSIGGEGRFSVTGTGTSTSGQAYITSGSMTANAPAVNVFQYWNNSGVTFTGIVANFYSGWQGMGLKASGANSLLLDLRTDDGSIFAVNKSGNVYTAGNVTGNYFIGNGSQLTGLTALAVARIANGTSNMAIPTASGDISFSVSGNTNVLRVTGTGANVNGNVSANYFIGNGSLLTGITVSGGTAITNGTSNVVVDANGNVRTSVATIANVLVVAATGATVSSLNVTNNLLVTNTATAKQLVADTGIITANTLAVNVSQYWNNSSARFTSMDMNITDGGSNANSLLINLRRNNVVQFAINKSGNAFFAAPLDTTDGSAVTIANNLTVSNNITVTNTATAKQLVADTGIITANTLAVNVSQYWNNSSARFTSMDMNITDGGSNANSLLINLRRNNVVQFAINKSGNAFFAAPLATTDGTAVTIADNLTVSNNITVTNTATAKQLVADTGIITANTLAVNVSQYWNNASATFTSIYENITDGGSTANSKLIDLRTGGAVRFAVNKSGNAFFAGTIGAVDGNILTVANNLTISNNLSVTNTANARQLIAYNSDTAIVTTLDPAVNVFQYWNNASITFTGILADFYSIGNNSAANSLLINLRANGTPQFAVNKSGNAFFGGTIAASNTANPLTVANNLTVSNNLFVTNTANAKQLIAYDTTQLAASNAAVNVYQYWNNASIAFTGILADFYSIGNNSAANSLLINLRANGTPQFAVNKSGNVYFSGSLGTTDGSAVTFANIAPNNITVTNTANAKQLIAYDTTQLAASNAAVNVYQHWNNASVAFTGILADFYSIGNNSAANSLLINLRANGTPQFAVNKSGNAFFGGTIASSNTALPLTVANNLTVSNNITVTNNVDAKFANLYSLGMTASTPGVNVYQTWNNASATFTGILGDFTSQSGNSAANSLLIEMRAEGTTEFAINKSGNAFFGGPLATTDGTALTFANAVSARFATVGSGSLTANTPAITTTQTWNNASVQFTGIDMNITDTASAAASRLLDLRVGSASQFSVTKTGNVSGNFFIGNGSQLTGIVAAAGPFISNGTSNVNIPAVNGNVNISAAGNANIFVVTGTGANITGTANISGNANVGNIGTARVLATANITAPQLISNIATGTAPFVVTSNTVVANLNADLLEGYNPGIANTANTIALRDTNGNLSANFFVGNGSQLTGITTSLPVANGVSNVNIPTASGNVNISVGGVSNVLVVTTAGANITGTANVTGNVSANFFIGNGSQLTGIVAAAVASISNGTSNVNIPAANGNVNISAVGNANIVVVTGTGANVAGTLNANGNANVGNLGTATGIFTTAANTGLVQNGTSNVTIASGANVSVFTAGNATAQFVVTSTGANIPGTANVVGNANVGNIGANNAVFTGNISGNTNGFAIGYLNIPQVAAANATLALTDAGKHYYSTSAGNFTLTVPNNTTTSFATGSAISIVVQSTGNVLVNAASGVTLYMAGNSTAANRIVSNYGMATLLKVATDTWMINGTGVA